MGSSVTTLQEALESAREGRRLLHQLSGPRGENLERAIICFQLALPVFQREGRHDYRATVLNDLAQAYEARLTGDRSDNQEQALRLYREALQVYHRAAYPQPWAAIQLNLGNLYLARVADERDENQVRAKAHYENALAVFAEKETPGQWGRALTGLSLYYLEAVTGQRADNLEAALTCLDQALRVFDPAECPVDYADAQNNRGTALRHRLRGDRADNLEAALRCYEAALKVLDPADHQRLWGDVHHNLGLTYAERIRGERAVNLQEAQAHLALAMQARQAAGLDLEASKTRRQQIALGITGQVGNQAEQIEQAVQDLEDAEEEVSIQAHPLEWARTHLALGTAYLMRARGDRVRNVEAAIEHFEKALEVLTVRSAPAEWSHVQNSLAAAYRERPLGERRANLERAIEGLAAGLTPLYQRGWLVEWARVQNNLAAACWERGRFFRDVLFENERADADLSRAVGHARHALKLYTRDDYAFEWALSHYNLANALSDLTTPRNRARRWRKAIECFRAALEVFDAQNRPLELARALNDYGVTLLNLARLAPGRLSLGELQDAIRRFREAIEAHRDSGLRAEILRSTINLGTLYDALGAETEAYTELKRAVALIETLRADALGEPGQVHLAAQYTRAYQHLVDVCVRRGAAFWLEALAHVEASKGRAFLAQIGGDDYPVPTQLPEGEKAREAALLRELREIEAELRALELAVGAERARTTQRYALLRRQERVTARYDGWLSAIEPVAPDYVALRRGQPVGYAELQSLLDQAGRQIGVVELFPAPGRLLAFVLRSGADGPVALPVDLDEETLQSDYVREFEPVLRGRRTRAWMQDLGDRLFSEALTHLAGVELVYLVPTGPLHSLPLHALPVGNRTLAGRFPIVYAPSLAVLARVVARARHRDPRAGGPALVVGDPSGWPVDRLPPLTGAGKVASKVAHRLGVDPLLGSHAVKEGVLARLPTAGVVFFACHGYFNPQTPLHSGLYLARPPDAGERESTLTVHEIMQLRLCADLVVLAACQTGLNRVRRGDELIGLARAFLYAGASSVIVSLWSVEEHASARLMDGFFARRYPAQGEAAPTAVALQQASQDLLGDGYLGFFDWAPFIAVGDWQ